MLDLWKLGLFLSTFNSSTFQVGLIDESFMNLPQWKWNVKFFDFWGRKLLFCYARVKQRCTRGMLLASNACYCGAEYFVMESILGWGFHWREIFFKNKKKTKKNKESASFVYQQLNYPFLGHRLEFIGRTSWYTLYTRNHAVEGSTSTSKTTAPFAFIEWILYITFLLYPTLSILL